MLIKIKFPKDEGFLLIDNAEDVVFGNHPVISTSKEELESIINHDSLIEEGQVIVDFDCINDLLLAKPDPIKYLTNKITFTRNDEEYLYIFDTVAYICNDKGETLEKCYAGGLQSYGSPS